MRVREHPAVPAWVERFDRRGTEPFELFRSEFGQNSFKIQEPEGMYTESGFYLYFLVLITLNIDEHW